MAIFISRISRGRQFRELIIAVAIVSPLVSNFWFAVIGGTGISLEIDNPGSISSPLESGQQAAVMAILNQLPISGILSNWIFNRYNCICC